MFDAGRVRSPLKLNQKHERRNQEQIANFPSRQGVAHQEQIRCPVFADGIQGF